MERNQSFVRDRGGGGRWEAHQATGTRSIFQSDKDSSVLQTLPKIAASCIDSSAVGLKVTEVLFL